MSQAAGVSARFKELTDTYYHAWFRYHPEAAVDVGVAGFEHLLTPFAPQERTALVCLNDQLIVALDELGREALSADEQIDYDILRAAAFLENQRILELEPRQPDPGVLLPVNAVYQLTIRPVADRAAALGARLRAIPEHLAHAQEYLRERARAVPPLWAGSAAIAARQGAEFVANLASGPQLDDATLAPEIPAAARALHDYARFVDREIAPQAKGDFASGALYFQHLLHHRHFLDVPVEEIYRFGEELFTQVRAELGEACRAYQGDTDSTKALQRIQANHLQAKELLRVYQAQMHAAREFVIERDLVSLPSRQQLEVVETPSFLRHQIPFAAYMDPAPNDPEQRGCYFVTLPETDAQAAEHDRIGILHTCVHEAWPGHHLQFVTANQYPAARTLPRLLNTSATFYEGWALYCEQLMQEQGFLPGAEHRIVLLRDRLWRALRILIDIGLHTRGVGVDEAAALMGEHLGFSRDHAMADLTWYSRAPTVPLGYATGWALINRLRDSSQRSQPPMGLKRFHDLLLRSGSIALPLAIARGFGAERWSETRNQLFRPRSSPGVS